MNSNPSTGLGGRYNLSFIWPADSVDMKLPAECDFMILDTGSLKRGQRLAINEPLVKECIRRGIELFAVIGLEAEAVHDEIDLILSDIGGAALDVLTTWHAESELGECLDAVVALAIAEGVTKKRTIVALVDPEGPIGYELKIRSFAGGCRDVR